MKGIILFIAATVVSLSSCTKHIPASKVPSVVQNSLQSKFVNAADIEWEKKNDFYEAEFEIYKSEYKAHIDLTGKLIMYKLDIKVNTLPASIAYVISNEHADYEIDDADKLEKDGLTYYQVELDAPGKKDKYLVFTADGKLAQNINYML